MTPSINLASNSVPSFVNTVDTHLILTELPNSFTSTSFKSHLLSSKKHPNALTGLSNFSFKYFPFHLPLSHHLASSSPLLQNFRNPFDKTLRNINKLLPLAFCH